MIPKRSRRASALIAALLLQPGVCSSACAQGVYNLHHSTDAVPDLTDMQSFVRSATDAWPTPEEKCIAVWRWGRRLRRQTSCAIEGGRLVWDPILHYTSYGAMNCGVVSSLNISSWMALGYRGRYIQLGDHTVSEVSWDAGETWHLFDSSMSIFCRNHEGRVASAKEIGESHGCALSGGRSEPGHFYLRHYFPPCGSHPGPTGWRSASDQPVLYERTLANGASSYTDGFSVSRYCQHARFGRRYVLNLRPGESYVRHWEPLGDALRGNPAEADVGANDPAFFRPLRDGSDPDDQHGLNDLRGNGVWTLEPDLREGEIEKTIYDRSPAVPGRPGHLTFKVSAANVITSVAMEGRCFRRTPDDSFRILVSRSAGIRWTPVWDAKAIGSQDFQLRLRDEVAGHTECLVRLELGPARDAADSALEALKIATLTQLNRRALPALRRGANRVCLRADDPFETIVVWPALHAGRYRETVHECRDLISTSEPDGIYKATLGAAENGKPCFAVWRVESPTDICSVRYGVVVTNRSPRSYVSLLHSWDGARYEESFRKADGDAPFDLQVIHEIPRREIPRGARAAFIKCLFFTPDSAGTYNMPGIQDIFIELHHEPRGAKSMPFEVTYAWTEHRETEEVKRSHVERVSSLPHEYEICVGGRRDPTMEWVRLSPVSPEVGGASPGYFDGVEIEPRDVPPRLRLEWGENLALGKSYVANRSASSSAGNGDEGGRELTNGIVIAPTDATTSSTVQPATAFWDRGGTLRIDLDLGDLRALRGARVATHQPNGSYCHPGRIEVLVSSDGTRWNPAGSARHHDLWNPPGDYEAWEHDDDPDYASLPAGGRLAYAFPVIFQRPVEARFVRFVCTPLEGRGLGLSELQVFDRIDIAPWPAEVAPSSGEEAEGGDGAPAETSS